MIIFLRREQRTPRLISLLSLTVSTLFAADANTHPRRPAVDGLRRPPAGRSAEDKPRFAPLPPAPAGVTDLKFNEIYKMPAGPQGLEYSEKLQALAGRKVRVVGYMVKQSQPMPWTLLLSPLPMKLHEKEYGFAEDLPPQTIHVFLQRNPSPIVPFTPGLLLLTGRLELGSREEPDGRVSHVRLFLDPPTDEQQKQISAWAGSMTPLKTNTVAEATTVK
ncbi:MAG: hypothetical protein L0Z50_22875 [Verrucomicrobiales bacterium]|nr:hypothetical protein [Verrucomicrobiales bacterium]